MLAHRVDRGIALPIHNLTARRGWVFNATPRVLVQLYSRLWFSSMFIQLASSTLMPDQFIYWQWENFGYSVTKNFAFRYQHTCEMVLLYILTWTSTSIYQGRLMTSEQTLQHLWCTYSGVKQLVSKDLTWRCEADVSIKIVVPVYLTTQHNVPQDPNFTMS
jgi:hypothetical protein